MQNLGIWQRALGLGRKVIEGLVFDEDTGAVVIAVRLRNGGSAAVRALWAAGTLVRPGRPALALEGLHQNVLQQDVLVKT